MSVLISEIKLKNFRNFIDVSLKCTNKNVIIGMNDVGKSNLLDAIRYVFDSSYRPIYFDSSDSHNRNNELIQIDIVVYLDDDISNNQNKIFIKEIKSMRKNNEKYFYFRLSGKPDEYIKLEYSVDNVCFFDVPIRGINRTILDDIFMVYYIPPHVKIEEEFSKFNRYVQKQKIRSDINDSNKISQIEDFYNNINNVVSSLEHVKQMTGLINNELKKFNYHNKISIESNLYNKRLYDNLNMNFSNGNNNTFSSSGDGNKKIAMYAMYNYYISDTDISKIPIILLEEPENHLYLTAQIQLSKNIFSENMYENIFLTTHSPELLYELSNGTTVIKLKQSDSNGTCQSSSIFRIPDTLQVFAKKYIKDLSKAIFAKDVLIVEGYTEKFLFDLIMNDLIQDFNKLSSKYILNIIGVDFVPYYNFLKEIGTNVFVRTDNDIKIVKGGSEVEFSGLNRGSRLLNYDQFKNESNTWDLSKMSDKDSKKYKEKISNRWKYQEDIYTKKMQTISSLREGKIEIARIDFENDLVCALGYTGDDILNQVFKLREKKWHNLVESSEFLGSENYKKVIESEYFMLIKEFINA